MYLAIAAPTNDSSILCRSTSLRGAICPEANTMPKVLIADDSRFQAQLLASYLRPKGF